MQLHEHIAAFPLGQRVAVVGDCVVEPPRLWKAPALTELHALLMLSLSPSVMTQWPVTAERDHTSEALHGRNSLDKSYLDRTNSEHRNSSF